MRLTCDVGGGVEDIVNQYIRRETEEQKETFQEPVLVRVQKAIYNEICLNQTEVGRIFKVFYSWETEWLVVGIPRSALTVISWNGRSLH